MYQARNNISESLAIEPLCVKDGYVPLPLVDAAYYSHLSIFLRPNGDRTHRALARSSPYQPQLQAHSVGQWNRTLTIRLYLHSYKIQLLQRNCCDGDEKHHDNEYDRVWEAIPLRLGPKIYLLLDQNILVFQVLED